MMLARAPGNELDDEPARPDTFPVCQPLQLEPVSDGATHAQLIAQLAALQARAATMPEIEQAKGALMLAYGITADAAFDLLRRHSQNRNIKVRDIATRLTANLDTRNAAAARSMDRLLNSVTTWRGDSVADQGG